MSERKNEIEILNFDALDVEELEQRLDMAVTTGAVMDAWICGVDCGCLGYVCGDCPTACGANCPSLCGANCGTNCTLLGNCRTYGIP
jgi:hypothetical protein